jgi:hypothetical protein
MLQFNFPNTVYSLYQKQLLPYSVSHLINNIHYTGNLLAVPNLQYFNRDVHDRLLSKLSR